MPDHARREAIQRDTRCTGCDRQVFPALQVELIHIDIANYVYDYCEQCGKFYCQSCFATRLQERRLPEWKVCECGSCFFSKVFCLGSSNNIGFLSGALNHFLETTAWAWGQRQWRILCSLLGIEINVDVFADEVLNVRDQHYFMLTSSPRLIAPSPLPYGLSFHYEDLEALQAAITQISSQNYDFQGLLPGLLDLLTLDARQELLDRCRRYRDVFQHSEAQQLIHHLERIIAEPSNVTNAARLQTLTILSSYEALPERQWRHYGSINTASDPVLRPRFLRDVGSGFLLLSLLPMIFILIASLNDSRALSISMTQQGVYWYAFLLAILLVFSGIAAYMGIGISSVDEVLDVIIYTLCSFVRMFDVFAENNNMPVLINADNAFLVFLRRLRVGMR